MGGEWVNTMLGNVLRFSNGKSSPKRNDGLPFPVYGANGIIGFANETNSEPNTIIIGRVGSYCGTLYLSRQACWVTDNAIRAVAMGKNSPNYLYYLLSTLKLNLWRGGSGQPLLNQSTLSVIPVKIPPLAEQRAIAHILGTLDDKIELNRRMNETLEQMAQALFKSWFVDFEPVRAKCRGASRCAPTGWQWPKHILDLFPDRLVNSELGEIPEGWKHLSFEEIVTAKQGKYLPDNEISEFQNNEFSIPVWGGNGIRGYSRQKMYDYPILVLTCRGSNCGLVYKTDSASWVSNIAFACEPQIGSVNFIYVYFSYCSFVDCISGSAQPQITYNILRNKHLPYPASPKVCQEYSNLIEPIFQKISFNNAESRTLASLRDTLLPKLISGEIRIKDAEKFLKERGL